MVQEVITTDQMLIPKDLHDGAPLDHSCSAPNLDHPQPLLPSGRVAGQELPSNFPPLWVLILQKWIASGVCVNTFAEFAKLDVDGDGTVSIDALRDKLQTEPFCLSAQEVTFLSWWSSPTRDKHQADEEGLKTED